MLDPRDEVDFVLRVVRVHLVQYLSQLEYHLMIAIFDNLSIFVCDGVREAHRAHLRPFLRTTNILGSKPSADPITCLDNLPVMHTNAIKHQCCGETGDTGTDYRDSRVLPGCGGMCSCVDRCHAVEPRSKGVEVLQQWFGAIHIFVVH
jgi:hypothetical protein